MTPFLHKFPVPCLSSLDCTINSRRWALRFACLGCSFY
uniref:Uncharacterized protein n=1 Tax=Arundo donax TaxID=35708 RepID=A0A0A9E244_ARUDO